MTNFIPESYPKPVYIARLQSALPGSRYAQSELLERLSAVYSQVLESDRADEQAAQAKWQKLLTKFGCGPDAIGFRASVNLGILEQSRFASPLQDKMSMYNEYTRPLVQELLNPESKDPAVPQDIFHVSCTGYISPSPVQQEVSRKQWPSRVTHLYHMGCYASLPASRLAAAVQQIDSRPTRVVHTELCSLHFKLGTQPQDWIIQSLFADGAIAYDVTHEQPKRGLQILRNAEIVIPDSLELMTWNLSDQSFSMTLSRDVPDVLRESLAPFVKNLTSGLPANATILYAIHPGGPKILDRVQDLLELSPAQMAASRDVLFHHGNMSSATIPHIWKRWLETPEVGPGTLIVSLAFGPGLTIAGQVSQVVGSV